MAPSERTTNELTHSRCRRGEAVLETRDCCYVAQVRWGKEQSDAERDGTTRRPSNSQAVRGEVTIKDAVPKELITMKRKTKTNALRAALIQRGPIRTERDGSAGRYFAV